MSPINRHETYTFKAPETSIQLKGFVENGVTYESHTFYVDFGKPGYLSGPDAKLYVRHGAGWESIPTRHMIAAALKSLLDAGDTRAAFFLCWEVFEQVRNAYSSGVADTTVHFKRAFVDGRLKKRKVRGQAAAKVWIEPAPNGGASTEKSIPASAAAFGS
ncbi:MAG: hypothetical protein DI537_10530 [Stutzerimonas stutzeri]|nr:MAG: hypothetical protein DI537_10530 [Stutzerimonas stutzeri]